MAKGLKVGDAVTVAKLLRFKQKSEAFKSGLKSVKPGQVGKVTQPAEGRSVLVEFNGTQVKISSQRLHKVQAGEPSRRGRRKAVQPEATEAGVTKPAVQKPVAPPALLDYNNPQFIASVANKMLLNGGANADQQMVVVEIRLTELPEEVQNKIHSLMQAKLSLGLESAAGNHEQPARARRGRKPRTPAK